MARRPFLTPAIVMGALAAAGRLSRECKSLELDGRRRIASDGTAAAAPVFAEFRPKLSEYELTSQMAGALQSYLDNQGPLPEVPEIPPGPSLQPSLL